MTLSATSTAKLQMHFCVLVWGFTTILGKLISLPSLPLVWWRMLMVTVAAALIPRFWRGVVALPRRRIFSYCAIGWLLALHWLTLYGAVKLANASVAAACLALASVFTAMVEPKIAGRKFSRSELAVGVAVIPAVVLVVGGVPHGMRAGIAVGVLSAFFAALLTSCNKRLVAHGDPLAITGLELGAGTLLLTALAPIMHGLFPALAGELFIIPSSHDILLLLVLALLCTLMPYALSLIALRHMSAFSAQLALNLEPVYAIVLAGVLLNEQHELTPLFYTGVALIMAVVAIHPLVSRPSRVAAPELLVTD